MITKEPSMDMLKEWKSLWEQYHDKLEPNRKTGAELVEYLQVKYVLTQVVDRSVLDIIAGNIIENESYREKLPKGVTPKPVAFYIENAGDGTLKDDQGASKIFVGIDLVTGYFMVEGCAELWDALYVFRGLDEMDLENYVCVGEYIQCLETFNQLLTVVKV